MKTFREHRVAYTFMPHENIVRRLEVREDPLGGYAVVSLKPNTFASAYQRMLVLKGRMPDRKQAEDWLYAYRCGKVSPVFS